MKLQRLSNPNLISLKGLKWVWGKMKPGIGPQVESSMFPFTKVPFWGYHMFDPRPNEAIESLPTWSLKFRETGVVFATSQCFATQKSDLCLLGSRRAPASLENLVFLSELK